MGYLSRRNKIAILTFSCLSAILTILELLAVWMSVQIIQISSAIAQRKNVPTINIDIFKNLFQNLELTQKLLYLALATFSIFLLRSLFQISLNRRLLQNLGKSAAMISASGIKNLVKQNILAANHSKLSEVEYSLTTGIDKAVLTIIGSFSILISDVILIIVITISLFIYDVPTAMVLVLFGITSFVFVNRFATKKLKTIGRVKTNLDISLSAAFRDAISVAGEARDTNLYSELLLNVERKRLKQGDLYSLQTIFPYISKYVLELGFLFFAGVLSAYKLAMGTIVDAASALGLLFLGGSRLTPALLRIQQSSQAIAGALGPAEQALEVLISAEKEAKLIKNYRFLSPPKIEVLELDYGWSKENLLISKLSVEILPKQLTCIVGKTGIGKTTFLRLLMGDLQPVSGRIEYLETPITSNQESKSLVYMPQEPHLMHENLAHNLFLKKNEYENRRNEIRNLFAKLDLSTLLNVMDDTSLEPTSYNNKLNELSKGEKQRLGIVRALLQKTYLYIFDEPTSALDAKTSDAAIKLILELSKTATVVVVTHDKKVFSRADKLIELDSYVKTSKAIN